MYGAEPTIELHAALKQSADAVGLGDRYTILPCGGDPESLVPALAREGLLDGKGIRLVGEASRQGQDGDGVFDTIICVRTLCSVRDLPATLDTLYDLLRPSGRFVIFEHVINPWTTGSGSVVGRACQLIYTMLGWTFFVGDCRLGRDTANMLREVGEKRGGWEKIEVRSGTQRTVLPFVFGVFVKSAQRG